MMKDVRDGAASPNYPKATLLSSLFRHPLRKCVMAIVSGRRIGAAGGEDAWGAGIRTPSVETALVPNDIGPWKLRSGCPDVAQQTWGSRARVG